MMKLTDRDGRTVLFSARHVAFVRSRVDRAGPGATIYFAAGHFVDVQETLEQVDEACRWPE